MDAFEDFIIVVLVIGLFVGIVTGVAQMLEASEHNNCHEKGDLAQVQVTYRKWNGCYANSNGLWMPFDKWQYNREHGIKNP